MVEQKQIKIDARDFVDRVRRLFASYNVNFEYKQDFENLGVSTFVAEITETQTRIMYNKSEAGEAILTIANNDSELLKAGINESGNICIDEKCDDGRPMLSNLDGKSYRDKENKYLLFSSLTSYLAKNKKLLRLKK